MWAAVLRADFMLSFEFNFRQQSREFFLLSLIHHFGVWISISKMLMPIIKRTYISTIFKPGKRANVIFDLIWKYMMESKEALENTIVWYECTAHEKNHSFYTNRLQFLVHQTFPSFAVEFRAIHLQLIGSGLWVTALLMLLLHLHLIVVWWPKDRLLGQGKISTALHAYGRMKPTANAQNMVETSTNPRTTNCYAVDSTKLTHCECTTNCALSCEFSKIHFI